MWCYSVAFAQLPLLGSDVSSAEDIRRLGTPGRSTPVGIPHKGGARGEGFPPTMSAQSIDYRPVPPFARSPIRPAGAVGIMGSPFVSIRLLVVPM